ncbi:MAG: EscR/YscR/HrcR family type III secretion system export apparatus protein [Desulfobacteraceae bacterium]|nr:EscR/YscR/HrcR family type III secretion system export apparatus protein [Desulfobacteraceae bacterium]
MSEFPFADPFYLALGFFVIGLVPFAAIMVTSYIKLSVVLAIIRNALGVQQIPPNLVLNGLAMILSLYIMAPVAQDMYAIASKEDILNKDKNFKQLVGAAQKTAEPLRIFLKKHAQPREAKFFLKSAHAIWPKEKAEKLKIDDMIVLVPAFTVSELTSAFEIGFLLYLPFITIDLIISNILLAMGMMMVSPMTISLPFKLLLFVMLNGWSMMIHGIVLTYR